MSHTQTAGFIFEQEELHVLRLKTKRNILPKDLSKVTNLIILN